MIGLAKANRGGSTVSHILVAVMLGGLVLTTGAAVRSGAATSAANLFCELPAFGIDCPERLDERTGTDPGQLPRRADVEANGEEAGTGWSSAPWELPAPTQTATATVDFGWTKPAEGFSGKRFAIAGMAGVAPAGAATATSGGTAAAGAGSTGLAGVASLFLSGVAFFTAMVIPYPWNDTGTGERELAEGVELRWDYAQLDSLTVVGPNGDVLLSAREAANYFVLPDGLIVATKTDSGPELRSWVQERVIGGDTYENATRVAKPNASATPYPPELPKLLGFPDNSDYVSKDQGYALPVPLGALPGLAHPDLEAAGIHPGELHVDLVDRGSPLEEPIQRLRDLARPAQTIPHSSDGSRLAAELQNVSKHIAADARARDREVAAGRLDAARSMEEEVDNTTSVYDSIPEVLNRYGVEAELAFVPVPEGMMETPNESRPIVRILSATNERFQDLLDLRDQLEDEGLVLPELIYEPVRADFAADTLTWVGPDGQRRIALSTSGLQAAVQGQVAPIVRELLRAVGQTATRRRDGAYRFGTHYQAENESAGDPFAPSVATAGDDAVLQGESAVMRLSHAISHARGAGSLEVLVEDPIRARMVSEELSWAVHDGREAVHRAREQRMRNADAIQLLLDLNREDGLFYDPSQSQGFRVSPTDGLEDIDPKELAFFEMGKEMQAELGGEPLARGWQLTLLGEGVVTYDEQPAFDDGQSRTRVGIHSLPGDGSGSAVTTSFTLQGDRFPTEIEDLPHDEALDYLQTQQESLREVDAEAQPVRDRAIAMQGILAEYRKNRFAISGVSETRFARDREHDGEDEVRFRAGGVHSITYRKGDGDHAEAEVVVYAQSNRVDLATSPSEAAVDHKTTIPLPRVSWNPRNIRRIVGHRELRQALETRQRELEQAWQVASDGE